MWGRQRVWGGQWDVMGLRERSKPNCSGLGSAECNAAERGVTSLCIDKEKKTNQMYLIHI